MEIETNIGMKSNCGIVAPHATGAPHQIAFLRALLFSDTSKMFIYLMICKILVAPPPPIFWHQNVLSKDFIFAEHTSLFEQIILYADSVVK